MQCGDCQAQHAGKARPTAVQVPTPSRAGECALHGGAGVMGTLAGMPGPPLIIMFEILKVPKVRMALRAVWRLRMCKAVSRFQGFPL